MAVEVVEYKSVAQKENNEDSHLQPDLQPPKGLGARHAQALLLFVCLSVGYSMRAHLSVSMVAMTSNATLRMWYPNVSCLYETYKFANEEKAINDTVFIGDDTESCEQMQVRMNKWSVYKVYSWHKPTQEMILFSFFVGYTGMMIPMGMLSQKFGGKIPIMVALGTNGILSILTPWMPIFSGWLGVCICRLLQGVTQAAFYPSIHTILGRWAPLSERSRLASYIYSGSPFGTVLGFQISGFFAGNPVLGWPATFWICGVGSLVCLGLLAWLGSATPHEHPNICTEELVYILGDGGADVVPKKRRTPWLQILSSPPIWGLVVAHTGSAMGYLLILTQIPLYMNKVLGVNIQNNGIMSSLPYISMYFTGILFGNLGDWLIVRKLMSIVNIRRVGNTIGMVGSSIFLIGFCYVKSTLVAVILLVLCLSVHSSIHVGFHVNSIDLAPNFAGPIMALGNMLANLASLLNPVLVSNIVGDDVTNQYKWQILFLIIAGIHTITNFIYVVLARGSVQTWNFHDEHRQGDEKDGKNVQFEEKNKSVKS